MNESNSKLIVTKIEEGTVIDRIPPGKALKVLSVLGIDANYPYEVALAMRVSSRKLGLKDLVKIKGRQLTEKEIQQLSFIAPKATVNIIEDYTVKKKINLSIPKSVVDFIKCLNPNCVSNANEPIKSSFDVISEQPLILRCIYCDRHLEQQFLHRNM